MAQLNRLKDSVLQMAWGHVDPSRCRRPHDLPSRAKDKRKTTVLTSATSSFAAEDFQRHPVWSGEFVPSPTGTPYNGWLLASI